MSLDALSPAPIGKGVTGVSSIVSHAQSENGGFSQAIHQFLDKVSETGRQADAQAQSASLGKANVVDVVTAVAESETALQTLVAVRDRMVSAYEDVMRMQI